MSLTPQQLTLIDIRAHTPKPNIVMYGSEYLFERAHYIMRRKGYLAAMVVYQPDGKVKVRWVKRENQSEPTAKVRE